MLKALAKLVYDYAFGRARDPEMLDRGLDGIPVLNLSHTNPMWRYYELKPADRESHALSGLAEYLPAEHTDGTGITANRDIKRSDPTDQTMRLGAKHNDIFPLLGDMVRWRLGLPSRHGSSLDEAVVE